MSWLQHLILVPILLPLLCGALLALINESKHQLKFFIGLASTVTLVVLSVVLMILVDREIFLDGIGVYLSGNWIAPFGISLVLDRLSALMLLLSSLLGVSALFYSMLRWSRIGVHYHSLFQFLLMGINGAFLTHDLFNLFVFFEVMLAASYGLLLHGYNATRIRAGMQFIAINLLASLLFLIGVALVYSATGTLNMSDIAVRIAQVDPNDLFLLKTGFVALAIAFLVKSAVWPLGFWLPNTYAAASPPVAAMFVLMTKVGVYVILRLWSLAFGGDQGDVTGFAYEFFFWGGIATIIFGAAGIIANDDHARIGGYAAIMSSGTLLAVFGLGKPAVISSMLFYMVSSTLAVAALMLLVELIQRSRNPIEAMLAITAEAFEFEERPDQPVGVGIPGALAFVGLAFITCALIVTGIPPLPGFIAKFSLIHELLLTDADGAISMTSIVFITALLLGGLLAIVGLMRTGVRTFWASGMVPARLHITEVAPIIGLVCVCALMTVCASGIFGYLDRAAVDIYQSQMYLDRILLEQVVPGVVNQEEGL